MRVRLIKSLTPHLGPESAGEVVGIEFCPNEPSIIGKHGVRPSVSSSGFAFVAFAASLCLCEIWQLRGLAFSGTAL